MAAGDSIREASQQILDKADAIRELVRTLEQQEGRLRDESRDLDRRADEADAMEIEAQRAMDIANRA